MYNVCIYYVYVHVRVCLKYAISLHRSYGRDCTKAHRHQMVVRWSWECHPKMSSERGAWLWQEHVFQPQAGKTRRPLKEQSM